MTAHKAVVSIPMVSQIPKDRAVNVWGFMLTASAAAEIDAIETALRAFYDAWANYRSAHWNPSMATITWYDMMQARPRVPVAEHVFGLSSAKGTATLPHQLACCLSFQGERVAGQNQASNRGRVYLGPLAVPTGNSTTGAMDTTFVNTVATAAGGLVDASNAAAWAWIVYSTKRGPNGPHSVVHRGWVDNEFDTQRRRSVDATTRTEWEEFGLLRVGRALDDETAGLEETG